MSIHLNDHRVVRFVVWWHRAVLVSTFWFFVVLFVSMATRTDNPAAKLFVAVWLVPSLFVAVRSARSASIEFEADRIVVRGLVRTRRIPLSRIREVAVGRGGSVVLMPWRVPSFVLDDGSIVRADEVRSLRQASIVDDVVAEAHRRLQQ